MILLSVVAEHAESLKPYPLPLSVAEPSMLQRRFLSPSESMIWPLALKFKVGHAKEKVRLSGWQIERAGNL